MLLETRPLANGTTLCLYDASRRQAADRWRVVLEARLEIPLDDALALQDPDGASLASFRQVLGSPVLYIHRKERVFVPDQDKDRLLEALRSDFYQTALPYLARPAFPVRFVRKQYQDALRKTAWQGSAPEAD
jgi:hypothetical protein